MKYFMPLSLGEKIVGVISAHRGTSGWSLLHESGGEHDGTYPIGYEHPGIDLDQRQTFEDHLEEIRLSDGYICRQCREPLDLGYYERTCEECIAHASFTSEPT